MGNLISFKLVKKHQWQELIKRISEQEEEIISATSFIKAIEQGNLETSGTEGVDPESLTGSLVTMQNKMRVIAQEEKERNWVTEGLARFSEILRSNNKDLDKLSNQIISELVKYMEANQGGLYLINNTDGADAHIELIACYAYNKKKHVHQRIELGEGLLGQAALEKATIYMTDIPGDYIKITSGLGEALPRNIIIVPMKLEEEVYGLVELASFQTIKKYQIEFIEKLSESLASTIATVRNAEQTELLLKESQMQAEQLRSQEEEMRQNMEELAATQEAIALKQQEASEQSNKLNAILDSTVDAIITIDERGRIETVNKSFTTLFGYTNEEISGKNINIIVPTPHHENHDQYLSNYLTSGQAKIIGKTRQVEGRRKDGSLLQIELAVNVVDLGSRKIFTGILRDITERAKAEEERQRILKEIQQNEKEINELISVSNDSIFTIDREYRLIKFNQKFSDSLQGMKIETGFCIMDLFEPEEQVKRKVQYGRVFAGEAYELIDHSNITGVNAYFKVIHAPLYDTDGTINSIAIYASDITEMYEAKEKAELMAAQAQQQTEEMRAQEEELRQNMEELNATQEGMQRILSDVQKSEKEINELLNVSTDSILVLDKSYRVLRFNRVFANSFSNLNIDKGFDIFEMFVTEDEKKQKKKIYDQAFAGKVVESLDHINIGDFDNYFRVMHAPILGNDGKVTAIAIFASDITELHKAKEKAETMARQAQEQTEELRAQEEELRQNMEELNATQEGMQRILSDVQKNEKEINELLNISSDSIFTIDRNYKVVRFNQAFANVLKGVTIEKGFDLLSLLTPEEAEPRKKIYEKVFAGEVIEDLDYIVLDGVELYSKIKYAPIFDNKGKVETIAFYSSDVTDIYKAKAAAEKNEKEVAELISVSKDIIITLDRNYKVVLFNEQFAKTLPMKVEKGFDIMSIFPPEDHAKKRELYDKVFAGEVIEIIDNSAVTGNEAYFQVTHAPIYDVNGKINTIACYVSDVTEMFGAKEKAEKLAREANDQQRYYNDVIEGMADLVATIDRDYNFVVANTAFRKVFSKYGLPVEKGSSMLVLAQGNKEAEEEIKKPYLKAFAGEHVEVPHRHYFDRDYQISYSPLRDTNGNIIGVSLIAHDITERLKLLHESQQQTEEMKAQEEELRQNMEEMQAIQEELSRKNEDMGKAQLVERDRADALIQSQKKNLQNIVAKFKQLEADYKSRIAELEKKVSKKGN